MSHRNHLSMPHPVLSNQRQDYAPDCQFSITTPQTMLAATGKEIAITVAYFLNSPTLLELIADRRASYISVVECTRTYRRESYATIANEDILLLNPTEWQGTLTVTPYVAATEDITGFTAPEHRPLIKALAPDGANLPAGAILAVGDITEVELDDDTGVESIFDLVPYRELTAGTFTTNLTGQRIAINVHPDDLAKINTTRYQTQREPMLHQALYLHALDKAIRNLSDHADKRWATVVHRKLAEHNINAADNYDPAEKSEEYAQQIFQNPLARMLNSLQDGTNDE